MVTPRVSPDGSQVKKLPEDDLRLLDAQEIADRLRIPLQTLYRWRVDGRGPKAFKLGRHLRYRLADVDAWVESQADDWPAS